MLTQATNFLCCICRTHSAGASPQVSPPLALALVALLAEPARVHAAPAFLALLNDRSKPCIPSVTSESRLCRIPAERLHGAPSNTGWYAFASKSTQPPKTGDAPISAGSAGVFPGGSRNSYLFGIGGPAHLVIPAVAKAAGRGLR